MPNVFDQFDSSPAPQQPAQPAAAPAQQNQFDQFDNHLPGMTPKQKHEYLVNVLSKSQQYKSADDDGKKAMIADFMGIPRGDGQTHYTAWQAAKAAVANTANSATHFATAVRDTFQHPDDTAKAMLEAGKGLPDAMQLNDKTARLAGKVVAGAPAAVGEYAGRRWGSLDAAKRTVAEDPIGAAADVATVLPGVGPLAKAALAPKLGKTAAAIAAAPLAKGAQVVADSLNPMTPGGLAATVLARPLGLAGKGAAVAGKVAGTVGLTKTAAVAKGAANALSFASKYTDPRTAVNALAKGAEHVALGPQADLVLDAAENPHAVLSELQAASAPKPGAFAGSIVGEKVPGSVPTAAQAIAPTKGATKFVRLGKDAATRFETDAGKITAEQNDARLAQVRQVGKTPADLEAAIKDRDAQSARDYGISDRVMSRADDDLLNLLNLPLNDDLMHRAHRLATQEGRSFGVGKNIAAHTIPDPANVFLPPGATLFPDINVPAQYASYSGKDLHTLKRAFDSLIYDKSAPGSGIGADEIKALKATRQKYLDWVEQPGNNPWYGNGRKNYAAHSDKIDQMKVGQYLESVLQKPLSGEDTTALRADNFASALGDPMDLSRGSRVVKNATGGNIGGKYARDVLTPDQMAMMESVRDDLSRAKMAQEQGKTGSNLTNAVSNHYLPPGLRAPDGVVNKLAHILTAKGDKRIAETVGKAMLTPKGAAEILQNSLARKETIQKSKDIGNKLSKYLTRNPAAYNVLADQRDKQKSR